MRIRKQTKPPHGLAVFGFATRIRLRGGRIVILVASTERELRGVALKIAPYLPGWSADKCPEVLVVGRRNFNADGYDVVRINSDRL